MNAPFSITFTTLNLIVYYVISCTDEIAELDDLEFKVVNIRRSEILQDVMKLYQDKAICDYRLSVQFVEEVGMDCGGLTEDLFASFWEEAFDKYTLCIPQQNLWMQG